MFKDHQRKLQAITTKHAGGDFAGFAEEIAGRKQRYADKIEGMLRRDYGILSEGVEGLTIGTLQRLQLAGERTHKRVIFNTVVSTVVAGCATLMFFNNLAMRKNLDTLSDRLDEKDAPRR